MGDLEISSSGSKDEDSRSEVSSKKDKKRAKKENSLRGSKYYKALAEDIIASQIESSKEDDTSLSNVTPSSDMDMSGNEEQPPPKWFIEAFNQVIVVYCNIISSRQIWSIIFLLLSNLSNCLMADE